MQTSKYSYKGPALEEGGMSKWCQLEKEFSIIIKIIILVDNITLLIMEETLIKNCDLDVINASVQILVWSKMQVI